MDTTEILKHLDSAMKAITVSDLGDSILQPEKFDAFVRAMQRRTNVLPEARFIAMDSQQVDIDRIGFPGRVITQGITAAGVDKGSETEVKPAFNTNKLQAAEFRAKVSLSDRALRRNIERGGLEGTLISLFGEAAGRDWEELALLGDSDITDPLWLSTTNGWLKKATNSITEVDVAASTYPENLFEAALLEMPKQFWTNPGDFRFYVPWEVANSYHNILKARGTALGDSAQTGAPRLFYKGTPVVPTAMLERSEEYKIAALLAPPANLVWGIFHEVTIEPDRIASARRTDFYLTFEGDVHYEDENGAVAVLVEEDS
jgi:hypothetical protein